MSKLGDLIKKGLGAFTGGDLASNLVANYLTSKVLGGDTKDALMFTALQQGLGSIWETCSVAVLRQQRLIWPLILFLLQQIRQFQEK
jgi:hypothetical protein